MNNIELLSKEIEAIEKEYLTLWNDLQQRLFYSDIDYKESQALFEKEYPIIKNGFIIINRMKRVFDNTK